MNCIHDDINTTYMQSFMQSLNPTSNKTQNETCADLGGCDWVWKIHINLIHIHCNEISITRPPKTKLFLGPRPLPPGIYFWTCAWHIHACTLLHAICIEINTVLFKKCIVIYTKRLLHANLIFISNIGYISIEVSYLILIFK